MKKMIHGGDIYRHPDMIDFSSNCNPFGPPQRVQDAICRAVGQIGHYPDIQCSRLRDALSAKLHVPGAWIFFGNGAAEVIFSAVTALKPKKALLPAPTFAAPIRANRGSGRRRAAHGLCRADNGRYRHGFSLQSE